MVREDSGQPRTARGAFVDRLVGWRHDRLAGVSTTGLVLATLFYVGANTPSLLPRPWHLQGLISAICGTLGYAVGVTFAAIGGAFATWSGLTVTVKPSARRVMLTIAFSVVALGILVFPLMSIRWQQFTSTYVGFDPPGAAYVVESTLAAVAVFAVFVFGWRFVAGLVDLLTLRLGHRLLRESLARAVASVVTVLLVGFAIDRVVLPGGILLASRRADQINATHPEGYHAPTSATRSGGPGSLESWESLGQDGAIFVADGPTRADIEAALGRAAKDPIRVFAGVAEGRTLPQIRDAVLAEMDRTGAFDRAAIYVVSSTSTGYVNEWSASAFEYLGAGDTAVVSMQYSTLPSALALMSASDEPITASKLLWEGVLARVAARPPERRPKVYVGGESLGAYGGNDMFAWPEQMLSQVAGAVWTGTPAFSRTRASLTAERAIGSTAVNPVISGGQHFRFASNPSELTGDQYGHALGEWATPRVVYLQHESDPVAWWSTDLLFASPDWLRETRVGGPMSQMSWYPLVTFFQVSADMAMSNTVPGGYGHRYTQGDTVPAWAAVLGLDPRADYSPITSRIDLATRQGAAGNR